MPQVTVVVPVYNMERYLDRCAKALSQQTLSDLQVILVEDGSTDGSGKICDDLALFHGGFSVIHQENKGLTAAWKAGSAAADYMSDRDIIYKILYQLRKEIDGLNQRLDALQGYDGAIHENETPEHATGLIISPEDVHSSTPVHETAAHLEEPVSIQDVSAELIRKALERNGGRRKPAAEELGISERTLYRKIKELDIR